MTDILNIINDVDKLKAEVQSLKSESKYLRKKSEITPLIALYNHIRGQNLEGDYIVFSITFYTKDKERHSYKFDKIIAINDAIHESNDKGLNKVCDLEEITKVELVSTYNSKRQIFTYKFDK
jgi:hypothetical protein